jgi:RNA polymerase sigma-70 factor (ECF subfamily)
VNVEAAVSETGASATLDDFDSVYEAYYQPVYRAVRAIVLEAGLAEDVTQNAFLKAYRSRGRYQPTGSLGGWLHKIAVREAISALRWRSVHDRLLGALTLHAKRPMPEQGLGDMLTQLLRTLNPGTRAAVTLHYFHGYRYREIASMLRIPEGTVATRISNGLRQMRRAVDSD